MKIEIKTTDKLLASELQKNTIEGISVEVKEVMRFSDEFANLYIITFLISQSGIFTNELARLYAKWLFDKLTNSKEKTVTINGKETPISQITIENLTININVLGEQKSDAKKNQ